MHMKLSLAIPVGQNAISVQTEISQLLDNLNAPDGLLQKTIWKSNARDDSERGKYFQKTLAR